MNRPRSLFLSPLILVLATVAALVVGLVSPAAAAPYCGITWGSLPRTDGGMSAPGVSLTGVRAGQQECYDRLVIDLGQAAGFGGYDVRYAPVVDASGRTLALRGAADLRIDVHAPAYDAAGRPTYTPSSQQEVVPMSGYRTFQQVAWAGSYEGHTLIGLGVRAQLPMRVFLLSGAPGNPYGARLVIDVAHLW